MEHGVWVGVGLVMEGRERQGSWLGLLLAGGDVWLMVREMELVSWLWLELLCESCGKKMLQMVNNQNS